MDYQCHSFIQYLFKKFSYINIIVKQIKQRIANKIQKPKSRGSVFLSQTKYTSMIILQSLKFHGIIPMIVNDTRVVCINHENNNNII